MLFTWLKRYAEVGRSSRKEYWMGILCSFLLGVVAAVVDMILFRSWGETGPAQIVLTLGTFVPSITLGVRRMHDIDKSGWWILLGLIPIVGWIILIIWVCRPGQPQDNRFGAPPAETPGLVVAAEPLVS